MYLVPLSSRFAGDSFDALNRMISATDVIRTFAFVFDGDVIVLDNIDKVNVVAGLTITVQSGVFIQVRSSFG